jgi:anti-anti-sigma factor
MPRRPGVRNVQYRTIPATGQCPGAPIYDEPVVDKPPEPEPVGFWITRRVDDDGIVLALHGELDVAAAPQLEKLLDEVRRERHPHVLLDLNELSFVDSAGVSVLIKAKKEAEEDGSEFVLRRPTAQVHRVFALVGMVDWLAFEER